MKKLLYILLALITVFSLCACKPDSNNTETTEATQNTTMDPTQDTSDVNVTDLPDFTQLPMVSVSLPVTTEVSKADDGTVIFEYSHQSIVLSLNDSNVADDVILDFLARVDKTQDYANNVLAQAQRDYNSTSISSSWIPYQYSISYKPMRIDSGVLSLFGADTSYSGSSHPDAHYSTANYDLVTGDVLTLSDILVKDVTAKILTDATLEVLEAKKDEYRLYVGFESVVKDRFTKKFSTDQSWYFSNKGLCFYFAPYEIAPYTSGVVVAEIPYDKLTGILKPDYFPAERQPALGNVLAEPMTSENLNKFTQFSEVTLQSSADTFLLYSDYAVYNVTLQTAGVQSGVVNPLYTVFAAASLTPGDAILVQGEPSLESEILILSYESDGTPIKMYLYKDANGTIKVQSDVK